MATDSAALERQQPPARQATRTNAPRIQSPAAPIAEGIGLDLDNYRDATSGVIAGWADLVERLGPPPPTVRLAAKNTSKKTRRGFGPAKTYYFPVD